MKKSRDVTIYDIAKKLKLSTSTISRALKNHHSISDKTIKKVKKAAKEMGYRPNTLAVSLRSNKAKTIGVLVPTINQPFLSSLISGIEITAQNAGYKVLIMQSHDSYKDEVSMAESLYNSRVSGIICSLAMETEDASHFQQFMDKNIPLVFVDRVPKEINTYKIVIDNYLAGYKATKHLIDQGCVRIAHFYAGSKFGNLYSERKRGYVAALKEHNLPVHDDLIVHIDAITFEEGQRGANELLEMKNPPDGIFSISDVVAVGAIKSAKKKGVSIPEDLAIIGFNNDPIASIIDPELSSITNPAIKMGQISAEKILHHLESNKNDVITEVTFLDTEVVVRDSTLR